MRYKEGELERLHGELYDILSQVISTCERLSIPYFIIGGTAIGAHFDGAILPWDDDIDIGMEREDYERFCSEAVSELPKGYTLQSPHNEQNIPYYFAKVRKDDTLFISDDELGLEMHHGIYIDIFPFDRCPDSSLLEHLQRMAVRILGNAFVAKMGKLTGGAMAMMFYRAITTVLSKGAIYHLLSAAQGAFNSCDTERVTIIRMTRDHIRREMLHPPQEMMLGKLRVKAPRELLKYLNWHYEGLTRDVPIEEQINHAPIILKFRDEGVDDGQIDHCPHAGQAHSKL